jgi:tellurite resistance protein TerC
MVDIDPAAFIDVKEMWGIFFIIFIAAFAIDLGVVNRGLKHIPIKRAAGMTAFWVGLALAFGILIYIEMGSLAATQYYTAYVIEQMLSVDNLFVFIVIFGYFAIPMELQRKALLYGILGAIGFRALFIFIGAELLDTFYWMIYIFGIVLIITAIRTVMKSDNDKDNKVAAKLSKWFKISQEFDGAKLITVKDGVRMMTPLLICIITIELTDVMFAFDSIPAALAITTDRFIVYSSNIFAILGLRSLFFLIKGSMEHLEFLKYGLGVILVFVGVKMLISNYYSVDVLISLAFILAVLLITVTASVIHKEEKDEGGDEEVG